MKHLHTQGTESASWTGQARRSHVFWGEITFLLVVDPKEWIMVTIFFV